MPLRPLIPEMRAKIGPGAPPSRPIRVSLSSAGPVLVVECVRHRFLGSPSPTPRIYFRCPGCGARRLSLFQAQGRLGCRGCLGLVYQVQCHGRWDGALLTRLAARVEVLAGRPDLMGRYRVWARRLERVEDQVQAWWHQLRANVAAIERRLAALRRCGAKGAPRKSAKTPQGSAA